MIGYRASVELSLSMEDKTILGVVEIQMISWRLKTMPKATLTFNLPEEQSEYELATKAGAYHSVIWEFTQTLRAKTKYGDGKLVDWEDVKDEWWNLLQEEGIDPYGN
jgi:hypothetical protein